MPRLKHPCYNGLGFWSAFSPPTFLDSAAFGSPALRFLLSHQEQGVEHDRLREGDGQNRLDQNLC